MKNKKILFTVLIAIIIFVIASVSYNRLKNISVENSYIPVVNTENLENVEEKVVSEKEEQSDSRFPDIPVKLIDGRETTFWSLIPSGKVVVINSFASWCPPCKEELPDFFELEKEYKGEVEFVYFDNLDGQRETEKTIKNFAEKTFPKDSLIVLDPGYISYIFNTNSIPVTIVLDKNGDVVKGFQGMISKDILEETINSLL